jgi:hypothetical protein
MMFEAVTPMRGAPLPPRPRRGQKSGRARRFSGTGVVHGERHGSFLRGFVIGSARRQRVAHGGPSRTRASGSTWCDLGRSRARRDGSVGPRDRGSCPSIGGQACPRGRAVEPSSAVGAVPDCPPAAGPRVRELRKAGVRSPLAPMLRDPYKSSISALREWGLRALYPISIRGSSWALPQGRGHGRIRGG